MDAGAMRSGSRLCLPPTNYVAWGRALPVSGPWFPHLVFEDFRLGPQTFSNSNVVCLCRFAIQYNFIKRRKAVVMATVI